MPSLRCVHSDSAPPGAPAPRRGAAFVEKRKWLTCALLIVQSAWLVRLSTRPHRSRKREVALREAVASAGAFMAPRRAQRVAGAARRQVLPPGRESRGGLTNVGSQRPDSRPRKLLRWLAGRQGECSGPTPARPPCPGRSRRSWCRWRHSRHTRRCSAPVCRDRGPAATDAPASSCWRRRSRSRSRCRARPGSRSLVPSSPAARRRCRARTRTPACELR
jgi:hypothetical protein